MTGNLEALVNRLLFAAKSYRVNESDNVTRLNQLKSLEGKGQILRATTLDTATIWADEVCPQCCSGHTSPQFKPPPVEEEGE